jgi:predicted DNA-binding antitoxin AbrB/MazE fold protein
MVTIIKAKYENGVLKPLEPLDLPENQVVELRIEVKEERPRKIAKLGGAWAQYLKGESLSFEEIQALTHDEHMRSLERTLRQVEEGFGEDDDADTR